MAYIYGYYYGGTYWKPHGFLGQSGWYELPLNFYCRSNEGQLQASPNADFSGELYEVKTDYDGVMVVQNLLVTNALTPKQELKI